MTLAALSAHLLLMSETKLVQNEESLKIKLPFISTTQMEAVALEPVRPELIL